MLLVLKRSPEQEAALKKLINDQHNPRSASFHHWLKPAEFGKRFGVADSDL
jgi:subtilase family serine protease